MNLLMYTISDYYHLFIDIFVLTILTITLILVRRSKYQYYGRWLLWLVLAHAVALIYRVIQLIGRLGVPLNTKLVLLQLDTFVYLLDTAMGVVSLVIMVQMFKGIDARYNRENEFKQSSVDPEFGTWPPPPS